MRGEAGRRLGRRLPVGCLGVLPEGWWSLESWRSLCHPSTLLRPPCLEVGLDDLWRSLPTQTIRWFYDLSLSTVPPPGHGVFYCRPKQRAVAGLQAFPSVPADGNRWPSSAWPRSDPAQEAWPRGCLRRRAAGPPGRAPGPCTVCVRRAGEPAASRRAGNVEGGRLRGSPNRDPGRAC